MNLPRLYSLLCAFAAFCAAGVIEFNELKDKPKGLAKDYYINRLITERKPSKEQIKILKSDISRRSGLAQKNMDKILPPIAAPEPPACPGVTARNIIDANASCQNALTTVKFSLNLSAATRTAVAKNLSALYPQKAKILLALNEKNPAEIFAREMLSAQFLALFNASSPTQKSQNFSGELEPAFMDKFYGEKGFTQLLSELVTGRKFDGFRQNLLKITPQITSGGDAFFLGLNAVTLNDEARAAEYFLRAAQTFEKTWQRDNANFWLYLIKNDERILAELANSKDINIYSLYAKDFVETPPFEVVVPRPERKNVENFDVTDPFLWQQTAALAKDMNSTQAHAYAQKFYAQESLGAYAFFMQKSNDKHYFLMPDSPALSDVNATRKSMIYALARQESLFLPSVISTSYALGTMQIMPFLANHIGKKELKIPNFDQDDLFKPDVAYAFADHHLNYLEKFLSHPLFIAYAYNGGIGFTKKLITREDMFREGKFEPFLSIELVPVTETRIYGKKVLANYAVYSALTGSNIRISTLLRSLTTPSLTDKFRK